MAVRHPSLTSRIVFTSWVALTAVMPAATARAATVTVPGTSNLWLAGMPDGTGSVFGDAAPAQSPVQVTGLPIAPGGRLSFEATGGVSIDPGLSLEPPDGESVTQHNAENGIGDTRAPFNSLLGVFLGPDRPDLTIPPPATDFTSGESRNYLTLRPVLKQVFFIGDVLTSTSASQSVVVPGGASRLFLGTMDSVQWHNNVGTFTVEVVPEPSALAVSAAISPLLLLRGPRRV